MEITPAVQPRTYVQNDDHIFFDRVRRSIEKRETYDEFLQLINFFTQGMIDVRTLLVEAASWLEEPALMLKFREILGVDGKDPLPEHGITSGRVGWDKNLKATMDMGYKTSYKKITNPVSAHSFRQISLADIV